MRASMLAVVVWLGVACASRSAAPPSGPDEHAGGVAAESAGTAMDDFSSWRDWIRVNGSAPVLSKGHGGKWVDVFVEPQFADSYRVRGATASVGMRIVKAGYDDQGRVKFLALTVMAKMPAGYDPDHGDWYYAVLAEDGITAQMEGKLEKCIECHEKAKAHDYLYGLPSK